MISNNSDTTINNIILMINSNSIIINVTMINVPMINVPITTSHVTIKMPGIKIKTLDMIKVSSIMIDSDTTVEIIRTLGQIPM